jgi:hypothetical protein
MKDKKEVVSDLEEHGFEINDGYQSFKSSTFIAPDLLKNLNITSNHDYSTGHSNFVDDSKVNNESNLRYKSTISSDNSAIHRSQSSASLNELDKIKSSSLNNSTSNNKFKFFNQKPTYVYKKKPIVRLIGKNGEPNIYRVNISKQHRKYFSDIFNTLIDLKWRYVIFIFVLIYIISWLMFALMWFTVLKLYEVFSDQNICIENVHTESFLDIFLFSIETQQTIGYGSRFPTNACHAGIIVLMVQCVFSVIQVNFFL